MQGTRRLRWLLPLLWLLAGCPDTGTAMTEIDRVFKEPQAAQLALAAQDGDLERLQALLKAGADPKVVGAQGLTLAHYALRARRNTAAVMQMVLKAGADPIAVLPNGRSVPEYAVARDNADPAVVAVLLDHGVSPNWRRQDADGGGLPLLHSAASGHNLAVVKLLLQRGADVHYSDPFMGSALHMALGGTDFFIAAHLVDAGINLGVKDNTSALIRNPRVVSRTALEKFCHFEGGKRGANPLPEIAAGWKAFTAALAKRGVAMPCGL